MRMRMRRKGWKWWNISRWVHSLSRVDHVMCPWFMDGQGAVEDVVQGWIPGVLSYDCAPDGCFVFWCRHVADLTWPSQYCLVTDIGFLWSCTSDRCICCGGAIWVVSVDVVVGGACCGRIWVVTGVVVVVVAGGCCGRIWVIIGVVVGGCCWFGVKVVVVFLGNGVVDGCRVSRDVGIRTIALRVDGRRFTGIARRHWNRVDLVLHCRWLRVSWIIH